ncbi:MAG: hypothetical protein IPP19_06350 [Verrucomicrobia bacterium]|nr:hypothetical protein [Verrucomicrobiota bacterium]
MLCGLAACGGGGNNSGHASPPPTQTTPTTPTTPTPPTLPTPPARVYGAEFTVSPTGSDSNPGTAAAPFKSLEKARDAARVIIAKGVPAGGIAVWLRGGVYERSSPLDFRAADSGTSENNTVDWRGYPGETVRLSGGKTLKASDFTPVTSTSPIWNRLDDSAKGHVIQLDLKAQGITDYGTLKQRGFGGWVSSALELFVDTVPMTLARWPDAERCSTLNRTSTAPPSSSTENVPPISQEPIRKPGRATVCRRFPESASSITSNTICTAALGSARGVPIPPGSCHQR